MKRFLAPFSRMSGRLRRRAKNEGPQPQGSVAKFDRSAFACLADDLRAERQWPVREADPQGEIEQTQTGAIWSTIPGGHKWIDYFEVYDAEFAHLREKAPRILEIGVYKGASLDLWKRYFGEGSLIVGIDIDPACSRFERAADNIHVRIGSQNDAAFLKSVIAEFGPFDLIMDDGSHHSSHQIASFNALFAGGLKGRGVYLIEDLESVYWGHLTGQLDQKTSAIDFLKMLVDVQHAVFTTRRYANFLINSAERESAFVTPAIATMIHAVKFYRSICVVTKRTVHPPAGLHL